MLVQELYRNISCYLKAELGYYLCNFRLCFLGYIRGKIKLWGEYN